MLDWQFLLQNFGLVVGTYEGLLPFCECTFGGGSIHRWWGHLITINIYQIFVITGGGDLKPSITYPLLPSYSAQFLNATEMVGALKFSMVVGTLKPYMVVGTLKCSITCPCSLLPLSHSHHPCLALLAPVLLPFFPLLTLTPISLPLVPFLHNSREVVGTLKPSMVVETLKPRITYPCLPCSLAPESPWIPEGSGLVPLAPLSPHFLYPLNLPGSLKPSWGCRKPFKPLKALGPQSQEPCSLAPHSLSLHGFLGPQEVLEAFSSLGVCQTQGPCSQVAPFAPLDSPHFPCPLGLPGFLGPQKVLGALGQPQVPWAAVGALDQYWEPSANLGSLEPATGQPKAPKPPQACWAKGTIEARDTGSKR